MKTFILIVCGLLGLSFASHAESVVYKLDPTLSSITVSGSLVGNSIKEQGAGSLTAKYFGSIKVDRAVNGLIFSGGSIIIAENNGSWQPLTNGAAGTAPANYGGAVDSILGSALTAVRNIQLDLTSSSISVSNNQFSASGIAFIFLTNASSSMDYSVKSLFMTEAGSIPLAGFSTNQISDKGSLEIVGNEEILTLPVNASMSFKVLLADDSRFDFKGKIIAKRTILANSSFSILGVGINNRELIIQWESIAGQKYQVLGSDNLSNWTVRSNEITASGTVSYTSIPFKGNYEFFRILKK